MQRTRQHGGLRTRAWVETQDRQVECGEIIKKKNCISRGEIVAGKKHAHRTSVCPVCSIWLRTT